MKESAVFVMFLVFSFSLPVFGSDYAPATVGTSAAESIVVQPSKGGILPNTFGTLSMTSVMVGAGHLLPNSSNVTWAHNLSDGIAVYETSSSGDWWGNVIIPNGAKIDLLELEACDTDAGNSIRFVLARSVAPGDSSGNISPVGDTGTTPGCAFFFVAPTSPVTVDNFSVSYFIALNYGSTTSSNKAIGFRVYYTLQMSPAPSVATFNDVSTGHWAFGAVEALAASGITVGCGGGNFCPTGTVTRAEMAVFLARALGLHWPF